MRAPEASARELAERLVDTGIPWKMPAPTLATPWATDSWFTSMSYWCRAAKTRASPAVCEKPMSTMARAAMPMVAPLAVTMSRSGSIGRGRPRGTSPTVATPRAVRSSRFDASRPPTTRTRAPGALGTANRSRRIAASATMPTTKDAVWKSPIVPSHEWNSCQTFSPSVSVPLIFANSPTTTSMAAPNRNPVITARDRNWAIHPIRKTAMSRNRRPAAIVTAATS